MIKTEYVPLTIVDGFFKDPDSIRKKALLYEYGVQGNHPGYRTKCLSTVDPELYSAIANKIFSLFLDLNYINASYTLYLGFQWTASKWDKGWVHVDDDMVMAGVIYMTPNPPSNSGTSIYKNHSGEKYDDSIQEIKDKLYRLRQPVDMNLFEKLREENNNRYIKSITVENTYNRALIYPSPYLHAEDRFFGTTKEDSRLALLMFLTKVTASGMFPIDRANIYKI